MPMTPDRESVQEIVNTYRVSGRQAVSAVDAVKIAAAYNIQVPQQQLATSAEEARNIAHEIGGPTVLKIESADILHKTDARGVLIGLDSLDEVAAGYEQITANAIAYDENAKIDGVLVQQAVSGDHEVIVGAVSDPAFGKVVAFGLGGILVEVMQDVSFRLAPASVETALSMIDDSAASSILHGIRGSEAVDRTPLANLIVNVSQLIADFPEIDELDLNPVLVSSNDVTAVDLRILLNFEQPEARYQPAHDEILEAMKRIMQPDAVAVIGASPDDGKIGNSVMRNLIDGGYEGEIYPVHPRADSILGKPAFKSITDIDGPVDIAIFCIPARFVAHVLEEVGQKKVPGAILIPSGFAEVGESDLQEEVVETARRHNIRLMGPNIYGFYYTPKHLCATFCTPYDEIGNIALSSQSGGVGMAIIGFSRSNKLGVSAIVGLGNKADIDEDDLLTFFEQDDNTQVIAMHVEDLKDGRSFSNVSSRVSRTKPIVVLKAGRTAMGARAARSHTGALAGNDKVYDDILRQSGVVRARNLNDMLEYARGLSLLPAPKGENVLIVTGAGGSGVLLSDACVDHDLTLMTMPDDLDAAFREYIPPFGASGNPVDITGGEPPSTYQNTIRLALEDPRVHALILGYWHTIITPPMVFAELLAAEIELARKQGNEKPVVASLVGDVEVERACEHLVDRKILAYPYATEKPVAVLAAKYRWARYAGIVQ